MTQKEADNCSILRSIIGYYGPIEERNLNAILAVVRVLISKTDSPSMRYLLCDCTREKEDLREEILGLCTLEDLERGVMSGEYVPHGSFRNTCVRSGMFVNFYPSLDHSWLSCSRDVSCLNLQPRIINALKRRGISSIYDLLLLRERVGAEWCKDVPGLGSKSAMCVDLKLSHILVPHQGVPDVAGIRATCIHNISLILSRVDLTKDYGELCVVNNALTEICRKLN